MAHLSSCPIQLRERRRFSSRCRHPPECTLLIRSEHDGVVRGPTRPEGQLGIANCRGGASCKRIFLQFSIGPRFAKTRRPATRHREKRKEAWRFRRRGGASSDPSPRSGHRPSSWKRPPGELPRTPAVFRLAKGRPHDETDGREPRLLLPESRTALSSFRRRRAGAARNTLPRPTPPPPPPAADVPTEGFLGDAPLPLAHQAG